MSDAAGKFLAAVEAVKADIDAVARNGDRRMGYLTDGLTFNTLRDANKHRLPQFKNRKGEPAHDQPDGSDWKLSAWMNATIGEAGELADAYLMVAMLKSLGTAADTIKKVERGDKSLDEARLDLAREFADVVTYLDILAMRCDIDLGRATIDKFNAVSDRVGSTIRINDAGDDWQHSKPPYAP